MKTSFLLIAFLFASIGLFAQSKTESFKVYGECGMCKSRIEKAAKSVEGVTEAIWDKEKQMLKVTYDETKTNIHKIHVAVAKAGHDTDHHKADDKTYDKLHGCCKYDRPKEKS